MRIPRYWGKGAAQATDRQGTRFPVCCWRSSEASQGEAERLAHEAALALAHQFSRDGRWPDRYGYGDSAIREELIREVPGEGGARAGAITRNSYGSLVLNTTQVMFADVDFPPGACRDGLGTRLKRLFGQKVASAIDAAEAAAVQRVSAWVTANPSWGMRVYRTAAGLRCLVTQAPVAPDSDAARAAMEALGTDPLYVKLCRTQQCFRARLTPKPWRCGQPVPPSRFPRTDAKVEKLFRDWETRYSQACRGYATCRLVAALGNPAVHATVAGVVALHDDMTGTRAALPLA